MRPPADRRRTAPGLPTLTHGVTCYGETRSVSMARITLGAGAIAVLIAVNWPAASGPTGIAAPEQSTTRRPAVATQPLDADALWRTESDHTSVATVSRHESSARSALVFQYELGTGRARNQFAALVASAPHGLSQYDRVTFRAHASRPLRLAVTLRPVGANPPAHWVRSVYVDGTPRTVTVFFDDMRAVPREMTGPPPLGSIGALMFLIDTNNTKPGTRGEITLSEIAYGY